MFINKSKHRPSDQKFSKQRTESDRLKMSLQYSSRFHIYISKRLRASFIARTHWGVRTDSGPIAEVVASLAWLAKREANWSHVKIALERV